MYCPVCQDVTLVRADRHGIEIDYCPHCRGVWLDRGELDKIIERTAAQTGHGPVTGDTQVLSELPAAPSPRAYADERDYRDRHHQRRTQRSFLEELFDVC